MKNENGDLSINMSATTLVELLNKSVRQNKELMKTRDFYILQEEHSPDSLGGKPQVELSIFSSEKGVSPTLKDNQVVLKKFDSGEE